MTAEHIYGDEHLKERGFFSEIDHSVAGRLEYPSASFRFSETESGTSAPAPMLGQHNDEIFGEWLGLGQDELARLKREGTI